MPFGGHATVKWFAEIAHSVVGSVDARMDVKFARSELGAPKCSLEVYARDTGEDRAELAFCHAAFWPANQTARIKWLGRSDFRSVHPSIRGRRGVLRAIRPGEGLRLPGALLEAEAKLPAHFFHLTVAEALLGVAMAILASFGASTVELLAMDNGSGKLIDLYASLGFRKLPQIPGAILWMEAPVYDILEALPTYWVDDLLPEDFNGVVWLQQVKHIHFHGEGDGRNRSRLRYLPDLQPGPACSSSGPDAAALLRGEPHIGAKTWDQGMRLPAC